MRRRAFLTTAALAGAAGCLDLEAVLDSEPTFSARLSFPCYRLSVDYQSPDVAIPGHVTDLADVPDRAADALEAVIDAGTYETDDPDPTDSDRGTFDDPAILWNPPDEQVIDSHFTISLEPGESTSATYESPPRWGSNRHVPPRVDAVCQVARRRAIVAVSVRRVADGSRTRVLIVRAALSNFLLII